MSNKFKNFFGKNLRLKNHEMQVDDGIFCGVKFAVIIPAYNEALTISKVVNDAMQFLPSAKIYVYDNNSTDNTDEIAYEEGAIVHYVTPQGKGHVVKRMFADVEADIYIMVDGDDTYDLTNVAKHVSLLIQKNLDMIVGIRQHSDKNAYRLGHVFANKIISSFMGLLFGNRVQDVFSGYRIFSRRFVKSCPCNSKTFEIETELSIHALELTMPTCNVQVEYRSRPEGSVSKLSTYRDGIKVVRTLISLFREYRPFYFYAIVSVIFALLSVVISIPVISYYLKTGLVYRLPTAVLSTGLAIISAISLTIGLIIDTISKMRRKMNILAYLALPWINHK